MINIIECDICHASFTFDESDGMTAGFYDCSAPGYWSLFTDEPHDYLCDKCMWSMSGYQRVYGVVTVSNTTCTKDHPMPKGSKERWMHPDSVQFGVGGHGEEVVGFFQCNVCGHDYMGRNMEVTSDRLQ